MQLTREQRQWLDGEGGPALQWAMQFNESLGHFYDAECMLPVGSAHFAPDTRMAGEAGMALLERLVADSARVAVPAYLDPCSVDVERKTDMVNEFGMPQGFVDDDCHAMQLCRQLGFLPTYSCINYQTVTPPRFGEHLAWGDTGAAIAANSLFGARTNFEGGPSALASALLGSTPAYGFHLDHNRRANLSLRIDCEPTEAADWGAVAIWAGRVAPGYETVPVIHGDFALPGFSQLKQLGVALASYGGHALFHLVGATPEATSIEAACDGQMPKQVAVMGRKDLDAVFAEYSLSGDEVDLVVFAAPQLSIDEVAAILEQLEGRSIHENTRMILAIDVQVRAQVEQAGLGSLADRLGVEFTTGTCFYPEAPLMQAACGWRRLVTNSAKLANTLSATGLEVALRRLQTCLDAAVSGRLVS